MPIRNHRHERFAQLVATGEAGAAAYRQTYGTRGASAEAAASRLLRNDKVSARIAEVQRASAAEGVLTLREKREFLALVVRTPIGQIDENSPLCQWFRRTTGRRPSLEIRMPDKLQAMMLDAKLAGELNGTPPRMDAGAAGGGHVITEEELRELRAQKRAAIEWRLAQARGNPGNPVSIGADTPTARASQYPHGSLPSGNDSRLLHAP